MTQGINYIHYRVNIPGSEFNKILQDCGFSKLGMRNPSWNDHWITELHVWSDCVFMTFGFPHGRSFKLWEESQHRHCICSTSTQTPLHASLCTIEINLSWALQSVHFNQPKVNRQFYDSRNSWTSSMATVFFMSLCTHNVYWCVIFLL